MMEEEEGFCINPRDSVNVGEAEANRKAVEFSD